MGAFPSIPVEAAILARFRDLVLLVERVQATVNGQVVEPETSGAVVWVYAAMETGKSREIAATMLPARPLPLGNHLLNVASPECEEEPTAAEPLDCSQFPQYRLHAYRARSRSASLSITASLIPSCRGKWIAWLWTARALGQSP
jgi:hypothetical protein